MSRKSLLLLIAGALLVPASRARAQTFTTNDPVLKRIWALGMDSSKTWDMAQALFDSIGPRLTGSPGQKAGNDWLVKTYRSWGIEAKNEPYGTWRGWRRGHTHVDLIAPRARTLDALMLPWSPSTKGRDVTGAAVLIPVLQDSMAFLKWLPSVKGRFVLMSPPKASCRPRSEWEQIAAPGELQRLDSVNAQYSGAFAQRLEGTGVNFGRGGRGAAPDAGRPRLSLNERLEQAGAAGIITTSAVDGWGTYTVAQTQNRVAPAITMSCEDYGLLFRLTERNQGAVLRVNTDAEALGEVPVANTIATVKGRAKPDEYVMLSSHFDSWDAASGATDNGTGTIVMLEAMRILRQVYPNPRRTIVSAHWSGEEQGLIGSQAFAFDHPEIRKGLAALFNQDNGTGRIQNTSGAGLPDGAAHLQKWLAQLPREFQDQVRMGGIGGPASGGTDHASFDCYGLPAFGLSSVSWDYNPYTHHTNRDTFDKVVFDELKGNATITAMLVYLASEDPDFISRERANASQMAQGRGGRGGPAGWPDTCPRGRRTTDDTTRVTLPSRGGN